MSLFLEELLPAVQDATLKGCLKTAMVIRANNVSEYIYLRSEKERWWNKDFPNVAPPAPIVWIEWRYPMMTNNLGKMIPMDQRIAGRRAGVLIVSHRGPGELPTPEGPFLIPDGGWAGQGTLFVDFDPQDEFHFSKPVGTVIWMVGKAGELLDPRPGMKGVMPGPNISDESAQSEVFKNWVSSSMYTPWATLSFLHCKNVACEKSPPAPAGITKKRREAGALPPIRFHVLKIGLPPMHWRAGGLHGRMPPNGLHICRGHFKTFDEKPLFGKIKGTWWWPMATRGDRERGQVLKDYEMAKPKMEST